MCRFPALQYLDVSACRRVTDDELANLSQMPHLRTVVLSGCDDISDEGMLHLAQLTKLTNLYMSNCCKVSAVPLRDPLSQRPIWIAEQESDGTPHGLAAQEGP